MDFSYISFGAGIFILLLSLFSWKIVSLILARFKVPRKDTRAVGWRLMGALVTYALLVEAGTLFRYFDISNETLAVVEQVLSAVCSLFIAGILAGICRLVGVWESSSQNQTLLGPLSQAGAIICWTIGGIVAAGYLVGKGPWGALTAVGALAAVGLLIFKDPLLGLMASIQMRHSDAIRRGDWITMPARNIDGEVQEVTLWTVRVLSWDRSMYTFPTYALVSETFQNWRPMTESQGRRIVFTLYFDVLSISELMPDEREGLAERFGTWAGTTNLSGWRAYVERLFVNSDWVDPEAPHLVREKEMVDGGLAVEVYCFSRSAVWVEHEKMRSLLTETLLLSSREYGLRIRQRNSYV